MLVHETSDRGRPVGLELAFGTPRGWLAEGKSIAARGAPTSFGPVSYEIDAGDGEVTATVTPPSQHPPGSLKLRLRLPLSEHVIGVRVNGLPRPFDPKTATVDLSGLRGTLYVDAALA